MDEPEKIQLNAGKKRGSTQDGNRAVFVSNPFHRKLHGKLLALTIVCLIILAGAVGGTTWIMLGRHKDKTPSKPVSTPTIVKAPPLTKQDKHNIEYLRRIDGTIMSVTSSGLVLQPSTDGALPLDLSYTPGVTYSQGKNAAKAEQSSVVAGHKAVISYDSSDNKVSSIWIDYDK